MPDIDRNRAKGRCGQFSRKASFWLLMFLLLLVIDQVAVPGQNEVAQLPYSVFRDQLRGGNIEKVTIIDGKQVEGSLKAPITAQNSRRIKEFKTLLPFK